MMRASPPLLLLLLLLLLLPCGSAGAEMQREQKRERERVTTEVSEEGGIVAALKAAITQNPQLDPDGCIVEIGSEYSGGNRSTQSLHSFASKGDRLFFTVDIDEEACERAVRNYGEQCVYCVPGEAFLEHIFPSHDQQIAAAFLDNFDWNSTHNERDLNYKAKIADQAHFYEFHGLEMNNHNSQAVHLEQAKLVHAHCTRNCVIVVDDTWPTNVPGGRQSPTSGLGYDGKGGQAVPWLLGTGEYSVIDQGTETKGRFVSLVRGPPKGP